MTEQQIQDFENAHKGEPLVNEFLEYFTTASILGLFAKDAFIFYKQGYKQGYAKGTEDSFAGGYKEGYEKAGGPDAI